MNCKQVEGRLIDYLDGTLAFREREAVELHARTCSSCAERINGFTDVFQLLDSWKSMAPSPSFNARLEQRLEQASAASGWGGDLFSRLLPLPAGNPIFALALFVMISLAAVLIKYSPAPPQKLAGRQPEPFVANVGSGTDDLTLYRDLPVLEDFDVLRNFEVLQELSSTSPLHQ
jgi:anti-sigma-K factor RskA